MSVKNGIVHLWELPESEVLIKLPSRIQKKMAELSSKICGNNHKLAKKLDVNRITLLDFRDSRFDSSSLSLLLKLSKLLVENGYNEYKMNILEKRFGFQPKEFEIMK